MARAVWRVFHVTAQATCSGKALPCRCTYIVDMCQSLWLTIVCDMYQGSDKPWRPQEKSVMMYERIFSCMTQTDAFAKVGGVVVELGCGTANGAIAALRLGVPYFGVDRDADCLKDAWQRIRWYAHQMHITGMCFVVDVLRQAVSYLVVSCFIDVSMNSAHVQELTAIESEIEIEDFLVEDVKDGDGKVQNTVVRPISTPKRRKVVDSKPSPWANDHRDQALDIIPVSIAVNMGRHELISSLARQPSMVYMHRIIMSMYT